MLLQAKLQLFPEEPAAVSRLLSQAAAARDWVAQRAYELSCYRWQTLNAQLYREVRNRFLLPSILAQQIIRQVARAAKLRRGRRRVCFKAGSAIPLLRHNIKRDGDRLRIKTIDAYVACCIAGEPGQLTAARLHHRSGSIFQDRQGRFFLHLTYEVPDEPQQTPTDVLGVDMGIVNLAVDSDGEVYSGRDVAVKHRTWQHRRRNLQRKQTRSAKRKLRKLAGKQARYQRHVNHVISKRLVRKARGTRRSIALENLRGIQRLGRTVRRQQRSAMHGWGFYQLRSFVEYKAAKLGVAVLAVDPRNTSRECPECGHTAAGNRRSQAEFRCQSCGHAGLADYIAARNVRARALGEVPMVAGART